MNKFLKTLIVGAASGAAAAYFLTTEKGKELQKKANKAYEAYKENPDDYHQKAKDKATEYTNFAVDTFNDYKHKFESGELTKDDVVNAVKEKGQAAAEYASEKVSEVASKVSEVVDDAQEKAESSTKATVDDIVINYPGATVSEETTSEETISEVITSEAITSENVKSEISDESK